VFKDLEGECGVEGLVREGKGVGRGPDVPPTSVCGPFRILTNIGTDTNKTAPKELFDI
jgi:hypothetical protein